MLFKFLLSIFAAILAITFLRSVIGMIAKLFVDTAMSPPPGRMPSGPPKAGEESLKRDPVCGAFVAPSTAVQLERAGVTHYFCSAACRDKFV